MIFMKKDSGEIYEMLITAISDEPMSVSLNGESSPAWRLSHFGLVGETKENPAHGFTQIHDFADEWEFIGVL